MEAGEEWAYANADYSISYSRVRIQKIEGSTAVVRFLDGDDVESKAFRKPTRNLRCLWEDLYEFRHEARVRDAVANAEAHAADFVFQLLVDPEIATSGFSRPDIYVDDVTALSNVCGLSVEQLEEPVTDSCRVARSLIDRYPHEVAVALRKRKRSYRAERIRTLLDGPHTWCYLHQPGELRAAALRLGEADRPMERVIEIWLGQQTLNLAIENENLRVQLNLAEKTATDAIHELRREARTKRALKAAEGLEKILLTGPEAD